MKRIVVFVAVVVASSVFVSSQSPPPAADPIDGTWRVNLAKSTYSLGFKPPANFHSLRRYAALEGGWNQFVTTSINADGDPTFTIGVYRIDGQPRPVHSVATVTGLLTNGKPSNLTRSYRLIDTHTVEAINYTDGVAINTVVRAVAKDGKSFTETVEGKNLQGQAFKNVQVFERVR